MLQVVTFLLVVAHVFGHPVAVDEKMAELSVELDQFVELGYESQRLRQLLDELPIGNVLKAGVEEYALLSCSLCEIIATSVLNNYRRENNITVVAEAVINLCKTFKIATEEVCTGLVRIHEKALEFLVSHTDMNDDTVLKQRACSLLVNSGSCVWEDEWTVDVDLGTKPEFTAPQVQQAKTVTIVQLSDIHHDPTYTATGNAVCGEPTCCRSTQGGPADQESAAGQWGDYRSCDVPIYTLQNTVDFIKKQHKNIDYVYVTGDYVDHAVWATGIESNSKIITKVVQTLSEVFTNTTIVYALGNHEASPVNAYAPLGIPNDTSTNWLFELVSDLWSPYITDEAKETILRGGYYTMKLQGNLRVIVLNNIVCYNMNLWLLYESEDPYGQLKWLAETLLAAEKAQEKVHVLYHIPTGSKDCVKTWSREYHKIVDRFENTITAQFNGHSHNDEFHIFYSRDNTSRATNIAVNGGSVTTYTSRNMNYKVYTVDPSTWYILDAESWVYNLTDANLYPFVTPDWFKLYSFQEAYGVDSLVPSELQSLVNRMCWDHYLLQKYHRFYVKNADPSLACDDECLRNQLCDIVTANSGDSSQCDAMKEMFSQVPSPSPTTTQSSSALSLAVSHLVINVCAVLCAVLSAL